MYKPQRTRRPRFSMFLLVVLLLLSSVVPAALQARQLHTNDRIMSALVPEATYRRSFYLAMHAYPNVNTNFPTAASVFNTYFSTDFASQPAAMGVGSDKAVTALSFATFYMYETSGPSFPGQRPDNAGAAGWNYQPEPRFTDMLREAVRQRRPIVVHLNGTRWMNPGEHGGCNLPGDKSLWCAFQQAADLNQLQRDQFNQPFSGNTCNEGTCYLSLARGANPSLDTATHYRAYKKRNLQAAINYTLNETAGSGVLVAFTLDSETALGAIARPELGTDAFPRIGDYGPLMIAQFQATLAQTYGTSIPQAFRDTYASCMSVGASWNNVSPPLPPSTLSAFNFTPPNYQNACWKLWHEFRVSVVREMVADTSRWAKDAGIPTSRIFTHQGVSEGTAISLFDAAPMETALVPYSNVGIDLYHELLYDTSTMSVQVDFMNKARSLDRGWGIPEFNPGLGPNNLNGKSRTDVPGSFCAPEAYDRTYNALEAAHRRGAHMIAPFLWNPIYDQNSSLAQYSIGSCPPVLNAYRSFMADLAGIPTGNNMSQASYETMQWNFWPAGDNDGWSFGPNVSSPVVANGFFAGTANTSDGQIYFTPNEVEEQVLPIPGSGSDYVLTVRMNLNQSIGASDHLEVFWQTINAPSWSMDRFARVPVRAGDGVYELVLEDRVLNTGLSGRITKLRIDPTYTAGARFTIESIKLKPRLKFWSFGPGNDLEGWSVAGDLSNFNTNDGTWTGTISGAGPFVVYKGPMGQIAQPDDKFNFSMVVDSPSSVVGKTGRIFWSTTAEPGWSYARSMPFTLQQGWHVQSLAVGESPGWYGTIDQVLIQPLENGTASPYINGTFKMDNLIVYNPHS